MVVARYCEDISWISRVPPEIEIFIMNKGPDDCCLPPLSRRHIYETFALSNVGREAHSYLSYIVSHFSDLPDKVIFTQGDPFEHSPHFLNLVTEYHQWPRFQPLTLQFKAHLPPDHIRRRYNETAKDKRIWVDRTDCTTLDTVFYRDPDFAHFKNQYLLANHLDEPVNIANHLFSKAGCQHHKDSTLNIDQVNFSFGAIFAVQRDAILQHDEAIYTRMLGMFESDDSLPYILERFWMALFDIEQATQESIWSLPLKPTERCSGMGMVNPARDFVIQAKSRPIL